MNLPVEPGSYALTGIIFEPARVSVGRLGIFDFLPGLYVYLGSALGTGGLRARLCHHARRAENPRWHFDYLRPCLTLAGGWLSLAPQRMECAWSRAISGIPGVLAPAPGFGARDCEAGCPAHLFRLPETVKPEDLGALLGQSGDRSPATVIPFDL
ncbi:MAG TPA: GIY-YIG nuclease family protein [Anaerolineaceae bacterium]|nr:GIY-YIG nuclease family protein [Anaerolineaceae bacterium]